jgi:Na+-driven multidrug efflux pump
MTRIGLPAGGEFGLQVVNTVLVYWVIRSFGAAAQAGFGIGARVMQALFLPVLAISMSVAPLAGQNFGARLAERVRQTFVSASFLVTGLMLLFTVVAHVAPERLIGLFSSEPAVVAFGSEYLRVVSWNFVAAGLAFTASSMFQGMAHTLPPLACSATRTLLFALPAWALTLRPGFAIHSVWLLSVVSVTAHAALILVLLRREFARRLAFDPPAPAMLP